MNRFALYSAALLAIGQCAVAADHDTLGPDAAIHPHSAVLHAAEGRWQRLPIDGTQIEIRLADTDCANAAPPTGLWLMTRDGQGRPELLAPSGTALPDGHGGHIRLSPCGGGAIAGEPQLELPPAVLDLLARHSGLLLVAD
jgi:hypothetical protein